MNERVQVLQVLQVPSFCLTFRHFFSNEHLDWIFTSHILQIVDSASPNVTFGILEKLYHIIIGVQGEMLPIYNYKSCPISVDRIQHVINWPQGRHELLPSIKSTYKISWHAWQQLYVGVIKVAIVVLLLRRCDTTCCRPTPGSPWTTALVVDI